jgi:hypothetical protein
MDSKNPSTYNNLNFAQLSQALKSNLTRRKNAKIQNLDPSKLDTSSSSGQNEPKQNELKDEN